jgi:3-deoxy-D-manno-octulosonate 8-phosphate phosphatase (KDO 8-P phosphatase)
VNPALLREVRLVATDVDGVLTRGTVALDAEGRRMAFFSARDGMGVTLALRAGLEVALVSGARSVAVDARARELGIRHVRQDVGDKGVALRDLMSALGLPRRAALFIGDDLNDLPAFGAVGLRVAVADAAPELRARADWITSTAGGEGALREVVEAVLRAQERWEALVRDLFDAPAGAGGP